MLDVSSLPAAATMANPTHLYEVENDPLPQPDNLIIYQTNKTGSWQQDKVRVRGKVAAVK